MTDPNRKINYDSLVNILLKIFADAISIHAFGSRINGSAHSKSDLDLAILVAGYCDNPKLWDAKSKLEDQLTCPVDLLDFRRASTVMQHQILVTGQRLWHQGSEANNYEAGIFSDMMALNVARAQYIKEVRESGKIYG